MKICICGGGNLGHVVAGYIASQQRYEVGLLTRHPDRWSHVLQVDTPSGQTLQGCLACITDRPETIIPQADMILLCLPGFSIASVLQTIRPYLRRQTIVGSIVSSTGFFFEAFNILPLSTTLFGFQRVPFIARTVEYGQRASLLGSKPHLQIAVERGDERKEEIRITVQALFDTPVSVLKNHYEVSLTNSNPLLHTSRLYQLWKNWRPTTVYPDVPRFYSDWTEEAARLYIAMDQELQLLLRKLNVTPGAIPTVLDYYESSNAADLARKLRSIVAFQGIAAPMRAVDGGYEPDFGSRYFTEDFPYGLGIVWRLAHEQQVCVPTIDRVYCWGMEQLRYQPNDK